MGARGLGWRKQAANFSVPSTVMKNSRACFMLRSVCFLHLPQVSSRASACLSPLFCGQAALAEVASGPEHLLHMRSWTMSTICGSMRAGCSAPSTNTTREPLSCSAGEEKCTETARRSMRSRSNALLCSELSQATPPCREVMGELSHGQKDAPAWQPEGWSGLGCSTSWQASATRQTRAGDLPDVSQQCGPQHVRRAPNMASWQGDRAHVSGMVSLCAQR